MLSARTARTICHLKPQMLICNVNKRQFCKKPQLRQVAYKYKGSFVDISFTIILQSSGPLSF